MVERRVDWEVLFVALVLTAVIMAGMFYLGQELSNRKMDSLAAEVEELTVERNAQDLSRRIASSLPANNCKALNAAVRETIADVEELRKKVATYEQTRKLENPEFDVLKKRYTNLLLEYWLTTKQIEGMCRSNVTTILYLYSDPDQCDRCNDQGTVLTKYRQTYDERLLVFPLDTTLDLSPVNVLINTYDVSRYPTLVIQGDVYEGFQSREALGSHLSRYMNVSEPVT